ncbi:MAG: papain-like cysteine protease family protein [Alphaproteobacteria bacterium]
MRVVYFLAVALSCLAVGIAAAEPLRLPLQPAQSTPPYYQPGTPPPGEAEPPANADPEPIPDQIPAYSSQPIYRSLPPVDLKIPNLRQETQVWCWAAVAQQIINASGRKSPPQCALVAMANGQYPSACCPYNPACIRPGSLVQIQQLIANWGKRYNEIQRPSDPYALYEQLRQGRPIVLAVRSTPYTGHVVVLRGMSWRATQYGMQAVLHINDPIGYLPARLPFERLAPYWYAAIVVY